MSRTRWLVPLLLAAACTGDDQKSDDSGLIDDTGSTEVPSSYAFHSAFADTSSVNYGGQTLRQLLIDDMKGHLGRMTARLDSGALSPAAGEVTDELLFYFEFDSSTSGGVPHGVDTDPDPLQQTYDDIASEKNLVEKLAGNDPLGQHKDWYTEFQGWSGEGGDSPEALVRHWFAVLDAQAVAWSTGDVPLDPSGAPVPAVHVTPEGLDLQVLLETFLRGAIAFSQGTDDYLDDDEFGKGLLSPHIPPEDGSPYTVLEHAWDEGFGYFGASRTWPDWTDDQIADDRFMDVNGDGAIDLESEICWGYAVNAGERDQGAVVATDYTAQAWEGFIQGRHLLSQTAGSSLSPDQLDALRAHRDLAVTAWEHAIAATAVHHINTVLQDMAAIGTADYSFADHARHWSALKGTALAFQFNPASHLADSDFATLHGYLGDAPVLSDAEPAARDASAAALRDARALLGDAYGFDAANLGDDDGENGW